MKPLALLLTLVATTMPGLARAQTPIEESVLRVRGSAEVRVAPDLAVVRLGIAEEARTAREAQSAVNNVGRAILNAVRGVGIEERNAHCERAHQLASPAFAIELAIAFEQRLGTRRKAGVEQLRRMQLGDQSDDVIVFGRWVSGIGTQNIEDLRNAALAVQQADQTERIRIETVITVVDDGP